MSKFDKSVYTGKEAIPTGKLIFTVHAIETKIVKTWTDGKKINESMQLEI